MLLSQQLLRRAQAAHQATQAKDPSRSHALLHWLRQNTRSLAPPPGGGAPVRLTLLDNTGVAITSPQGSRDLRVIPDPTDLTATPDPLSLWNGELQPLTWDALLRATTWHQASIAHQVLRHHLGPEDSPSRGDTRARQEALLETRRHAVNIMTRYPAEHQHEARPGPRRRHQAATFRDGSRLLWQASNNPLAAATPLEVRDVPRDPRMPPETPGSILPQTCQTCNALCVPGNHRPSGQGARTCNVCLGLPYEFPW